MIQNPQHELEFGAVGLEALDLTARTEYDGGVRFDVPPNGVTMGNPEAVIRELRSSLIDGDFVTTDRNGNREPSFQVRITASDSVGLAFGEKLLADRIGRAGSLAFSPHDGFAAKSVYRVFTSSLRWEFDDVDELLLRRVYTLRLICHPFAFSESEVVEVATEVAPAVPSTIVVDDCSTTTDWTSPGSISAASGRITVGSSSPVSTRMSGEHTVSKHYLSATRTIAATDYSGTPFLTFEIRQSTGQGYDNIRALVDGTELIKVADIMVSNSSGIKTSRLTYRCADTSLTTIKFEMFAESYSLDGVSSASFDINDVSRSNVGPARSSTGLQTLRQTVVTGSARTAASIEISHPTAGLGDVLLYTSEELANGYDPALSRWATGLTDSTATVSGKIGDTSRTHLVPSSMLPDGGYVLLARVRAYQAQPAFFQATVSAVAGGGELGAQLLPKVDGILLADGWMIVSLGVTTLPVSAKIARSSGASTKIHVNEGNGQIDEVWAYHLGEGSSLTQVACGTGTPTLGTIHNNLFLDAPNIDNGGLGTIAVGTQPERTDAFDPGYPSVVSWGSHPARPPVLLAHLVTTGAADARMVLRHRPAWHGVAGS